VQSALGDPTGGLPGCQRISYLPDAAVDLVYLESGNATDAQLLAFEDTWPCAAGQK
jgi:hypothetical protein